MAIPSSGKVSIGDIRNELRNQAISEFSLKLAGRPTTGAFGTFQDPIYVPINQSSTAKPNNLAPYSINEWRSYNHTENMPCNTTFTTPTLGPFFTYYRVNISGQPGYEATIAITGNSAANRGARVYTEYPFNTIGELVGTPFASFIFDGSETKYIRKGINGANPQVLHFVFWQDFN